MKKIEDLSDQELLKIFKHFSLTARTICESVCVRWNKLMRKLPTVNYKLNLGEYGNWVDYCCGDPRHRFREELFIAHAGIAKAVISKYSTPKALALKVTNAVLLTEDLKVVATDCHFLEHLELQFATGCLQPKQLDILVGMSSKALKHLAFTQTSPAFCNGEGCFGTREFLKILNSCSSLESVYLNCSTTVNVEKLLKLPKSVKSLRIPSIYITEDALDKFLTGDGQLLEEFEIEEVTGAHLRKIGAKMTRLKSLIIMKISSATPEEVTSLCSLHNLQCLTIDFNGTDLNQPILELLKRCNSIVALKLKSCKISDQFLTQLPEVCPNIREIYIFDQTELDELNITDRGLDSLVLLPNLEKVHIPSARVSSTKVAQFLTRCNGVRSAGFCGVQGDAQTVVDAMVKKANLNKRANYELVVNEKFKISAKAFPDNLYVHYPTI